MGVRGAAALVIALSATVAGPAQAAGARSAHLSGFTAFDQRLLSDINAARTERDLPVLRVDRHLEPAAHRWAQHLAASQRLSYNPHLRRTMDATCPGWGHIGETVGEAGESTADDLFRTYMRDSGRRATILNRRFGVIGISTVSTDDNGATVSWNTIDFADSCGA